MNEKVIHKIQLGSGNYTLCGLGFIINEKGEKIINGGEQIGITVYADCVTCPDCIKKWDNKLKELCNTR